MTKRIIEVVVRDDIKYDLSGPLSKVLAEVQELIKEHGPDARIDIDAEHEPYSYSDTRYAYARLYKKREETDGEYKTRLAVEERYKQDQLERDRAAYLRLKNQFESGKQ